MSTTEISKTPPKKPRGFGAMSPERRREIASLGGKSIPPEKRSFSQNHALAASAGSTGGKNVRPEKRSFSRDPALARAAGGKGGCASQDARRASAHMEARKS